MVGPVVTGGAGAYGAQAAKASSGVVNQAVGQWFALIAILQGSLAKNIYPKFLAACDNDKALQAMLAMLVKNPKDLKDTTLSNFLQGFPTLEKEYKAGKLPPNLKTLMKLPQFKDVNTALQQMELIEKRNPNFKKDPQWIKLRTELTGKGGLFDQISAQGVKSPTLVEDASAGAQWASSQQQLLYGTTKLRVNLVAQIVQGATTFLNKAVQIQQRIDQQMTSSL